MDITFVLCPNILGILGLSLLLIFTRYNFYLEHQKLRLFITAAIINLIIIVFEVGDYQFAGANFPTAYLFRRLTSASGFALTPIIPLLIACIASRHKLSRIVYVPAAINFVASYCSIFTGHMFWIDSTNSYYRGPLFLLMMAISAFYLLLLVYISVRNLKSVRSGESIFLFGIVLFMLVGNVLEIVFYFHFIIWNSCALLLICYYLYLHIQYFKLDPLTQVFNRNVFNYNVNNLQHKEKIGVISLDLNKLKQINDTLGHASGDRYIVKSAALISKCFSDAGKVYRVGGDEFVVLMENTTEAEMIRRIAVFRDACVDAELSVACGYTYMEKADDIAQMLRDADDRMYENKRSRVNTWPTTL